MDAWECDTLGKSESVYDSMTVWTHGNVTLLHGSMDTWECADCRRHDDVVDEERHPIRRRDTVSQPP